ncbi:hypothetical protein SESBI_08676 [Sesbania bispinosa]|nr:hypothetical protein SESBI_08676 [Sesbania bispinosa]
MNLRHVLNFLNEEIREESIIKGGWWVNRIPDVAEELEDFNNIEASPKPTRLLINARLESTFVVEVSHKAYPVPVKERLRVPKLKIPN